MADTYSKPTQSILMTLKADDPLQQLTESPTHKLLLKQWLKEQDLILRRTSLKETQIDGVRREITSLYTLFFLFHSLSLLLLFSLSSSFSPKSCTNSWLPCLFSLLCSTGLIWAVRYKTYTESRLQKLLEREKEDAKMLGKCIDELKKKGSELDLVKEVDALRRAKSMRVLEEGRVVSKWGAKDSVSVFLIGVSCFVLGLTRLILCG